MRTEEYKKNLSKQKAVLLALWRLRFAIVATLVCLIAVCVLLGIAGNVYGEAYSAELKYGDELSFAAKAVFRDIHRIEYRQKNGEWSSDAPIYSGDYEFRAVSSGLGGKERYGRAHSFTIKPADVVIKITDTALMYGDKPSYSVENLKYEDSLTVDEFLFDYTDEGSVFVSAICDNAKICDANGNDVSSSYTIKAEQKELFSEKRPITIKTFSKEWEYDAMPHSFSEYEIVSQLGLLKGHKLFLECVQAINVGSFSNEAQTLRITDEYGSDVTAHYDIKFETGTLKVDRHPMTVRTASGSFEYDGTAHSLERVDGCEGLIQGHEMISYVAHNCADIIDVGSKPNTMTALPTIHDEKGNDVTENYSVEYDYGEISVTPREIQVRTDSATFIYDGTLQKCEKASLETGELVDGHSIVARSNGSVNITDSDEVGYTDNVCTIQIFDGDINVTDNYKIEVLYGKIRIKSPIVITVASLSKIYDGEPLVFDGADGEKNYRISALPPDIDKEWIKVSVSERKYSITNVGTVPLKEIEEFFTVSVKHEDKDLLSDGSNRVSFEGSPLQILPRTIEVTSVSVSAIKGDEPILGNTKDCWRISLGSLVSGHRIVVSVSGKLELDQQQAVNIIDSVKVFDDHGADVTAYYDIVLKEGTLRWLKA